MLTGWKICLVKSLGYWLDERQATTRPPCASADHPRAQLSQNASAWRPGSQSIRQGDKLWVDSVHNLFQIVECFQASGKISGASHRF